MGVGGIAGLVLGIAGVLGAAAPAQAASACKLSLVAEMPLVMDGNRPLVEGAINGERVLALADTGAFNTMLWQGAAERLGLQLKPLKNLKITGVGGTHQAQSALVEELKLGSSTRKNVDLLVGGRGDTLAGREDVAMILGQDLFSSSDVEIDLANKVIRLVKPSKCGPQDSLAYWGHDYSTAEIRPVSLDDRHVQVDIKLNGQLVRAWMDTGAYTTIVSTKAAARAGVRPAEDGPAEGRTTGVGGRGVDTWVASFDTFQFGDQTIRNAKLRVADLFRHSREASTRTRIPSETVPVDMLLGADFFLSHRVLISYSQNKVYFTHNGGQVFQLRGPALEDDAEGGPTTPASR